ncbi:gliding motility lipoprotein GldH [Gaoshiqia sediminis]|uniref:Gliding motility lipoprotein GldH n=1 Tax=Gaoshiqia sediminis TaxID=2986998 RepID=A0AA41YCD1_9BACT|nr:gliding motility lipoprotein GldH [Gaoshiqia sediminis]MCW0483848.1 gliding motility lipoprotein GldH [Gaoshiqia sediminis]
MKKLIFLLGWIIALSACDQGRVFEDYRTFDTDGWHKDSTVVFTLEPTDTLGGHNVLINIRNMGNYPNSNIWLFIDVRSPDGSLLKDTVEFTLADPTGKWKGSGIGDLFDNQFLYKQNVFFPSAGEYQFRIRHGMRAKNLKGIQDIGIRVEKKN